MMAESAGEMGMRGRRRTSGGKRVARDAVRIFWTDVGRTWVSFPVAAVVASAIGVYAGGFLLSADVTEGPGRAILAPFKDFWFLAVAPVLTVNLLFNRDYYYRFSGDNLSKRLAFLRGLPISASSLVAGRIAYMLLAFLVSAPAFFAAVYWTSGLIRDRLDPASYLCFAAVWCGYALFMGGFYAFLWHAVAWKTQLKAIPTLMVAYLILALLLTLALEDGLVAWTVDVAASHGALAATVALLVGGAGMAGWAAATARRLRRRDLSL